MEAVTKPPLRTIAVILIVPLAVAALWLLRGATGELSDSAVRHGVQVRALVLSVDGDTATVRIPRPDDDVVTTIARHGDYAAGDTTLVVYDAVDPGRASELGAPAPSQPVERALVVAGIAAAVVAGAWVLSRRTGRDDDEVVRPHEVRGGRLLQPERQPQPSR